MSARSTAEQFLRAAVSEDPGDLADSYADEVVIEMPFAPTALYPSRTTTTREELRARFRAGARLRRYDSVTGVRIHETADPRVVVVEYDLHGHMVDGGGTFTLAFAMVMTVEDDRIVHTRDYADPVAGARALGRLPELLDALRQDARPTAPPAG